MALKATIYKVRLQIADMDRGYYNDHPLSVALHPSENIERMMVRLLAFALNASDTLSFSKGLSNDGEPELVDKALSGVIDLWVEFGQSDEKWLKKACGRAKAVKLFAYGGRSVPIWWAKNQASFERYSKLSVYNIPESSVKAMTTLVSRNMELQINISEGQIWLSNQDNSCLVEPELLKQGEIK